MKTYSVLLLRPDDIGEPFGQDTFYTFLRANNVKQAIEFAQREALNADCQDARDLDDYAVLLVLAGKCLDISYMRDIVVTKKRKHASKA